MNQRKRLFLLFGAVILFGLLIGIAVPELFHMGTGTYAGFFSLYSLQKFERQTIRAWKLFPYLAIGRLRMFFLLWMSCYTAVGLWLHLICLLWLAMSAGMLLALFVLREGYQGILLFACCIFPQWLLYALAWKQELLFLGKRRGRSGSGSAWEEERPRRMRRQEVTELARLAGRCLLGCAAEAYLGLWTLKIFLQIVF